MTTDEIAQTIKRLAALEQRISEVNEAAKLNPMSQDIARLETSLAKQWNRLVSELKAVGVENYEPRPVIEEEIPPMHWLQTLFVESGLDVRDLMRDEKPTPSQFGDGLSSMVGN